MTKEEYVKHLIKCSGHSIKSFAKSIDLPYTTLLSMLKNGLGGAAINNVIRVCRGLQITVEELTQIDEGAKVKQPFYITNREKHIILNYRAKPEMQPAVDTILGVLEESGAEE